MNKDELAASLVGLYDLVSRLRGPGGCPWDAQQTDETIKTYLLEEAFEAVEAVEKGVPEEVCQELGDLLFQIYFLARLAEEEDHYDLLDVTEKIKEKMISRHPHVFGKTTVDGPDEVKENWQKLKEKEHGKDTGPLTALESIPANLPALMKTHRLCERTSRWVPGLSKEVDIWDGVQDDFEALKDAIAGQVNDMVGERVGTLLFSLANLARHHGLNAEHLLRKANKAFLQQVKDGKEGTKE